VLAATSETRIGTSGVRSTLLLERSVRGLLVVRDRLVFDTRYAASAAGKPEKVAHMFLLLAGRLVTDDKKTYNEPIAFLLGDDEMERITDKSRTFRTDGEQIHVIQLRFDRKDLRVPIGLDSGPLALVPAVWDAARALHAGAGAPDVTQLGRLVAALGASGAIAETVSGTLMTDEPERFRRLWSALEPLFHEHGATTSLKQLAAKLDLSMRQVGRDAKDLAKTFGFSSGYRDWLLVLRLRLAALLLSAPGVTVNEVAGLVGYGSPIAMARAFRDAKLPPPSTVQTALRSE
jgi:AraC-like DNA-binding protein